LLKMELQQLKNITGICNIRSEMGNFREQQQIDAIISESNKNLSADEILYCLNEIGECLEDKIKKGD